MYSRIFTKPQKFLKHHEYTERQKLYLKHLMPIGFELHKKASSDQ